MIIAFLQDFKVVCNACNIHEEVAMWLFKHYEGGSVEYVIKARVFLPTETTKT